MSVGSERLNGGDSEPSPHGTKDKIDNERRLYVRTTPYGSTTETASTPGVSSGPL